MTVKKEIRRGLEIIFFLAGLFTIFPALLVALLGYQGHPYVSRWLLLLPIGCAVSFFLSWVMEEDE